MEHAYVSTAGAYTAQTLVLEMLIPVILIVEGFLYDGTHQSGFLRVDRDTAIV